MGQKVKFDAAKVIKHMTEKELKGYDITLEKKGKGPSIPDWFKPYGEIIKKMSQFMIDQQKFNQDQQKFNQDQQKFNQSVLSKFDQYDQLFKKHKWIE